MNTLNVEPKIQTLQLKKCRMDKDNPRDISQEAFAGLRRSIERFGYLDLIIVNKKNMQIISGHQRFKILVEAGVEEAVCIVVNVDEVMQRAMNISLNSQQIAGYFTAALVPMLEALRNDISDDYLDLRMDALREELNQFENENNGAGNTLPDDVPEIPKKVSTRPGDLWVLGNHRLLCGDSTKSVDVGKLMDGEIASLFATDPPYLINYTGANHPKSGKDWSDVFVDVSPNAYSFFYDYLAAGLNYSNSRAPIYIWHASSRASLITKVMSDLNILMHQTIIWVKPCFVQSYSIYSWRHEPCLFGWIKGSKPFFRIKRSIKNSTVWTIGMVKSGNPADPDYYSDIWELGWEDGKKRSPGKIHPTIKPTEIFAIPMRVHTKPGDVCYEPFSGSGSQIIAGERLNRRVYAIEKEPIFCDVAVKRWEDFTGQKAKILKKGS